MDLESLVVDILDSIKEADENGADGLILRLIKSRYTKSRKHTETLIGLKYIKECNHDCIL